MSEKVVNKFLSSHEAVTDHHFVGNYAGKLNGGGDVLLSVLNSAEGAQLNRRDDQSRRPISMRTYRSIALPALVAAGAAEWRFGLPPLVSMYGNLALLRMARSYLVDRPASKQNAQVQTSLNSVKGQPFIDIHDPSEGLLRRDQFRLPNHSFRVSLGADFAVNNNVSVYGLSRKIDLSAAALLNRSAGLIGQGCTLDDMGRTVGSVNPGRLVGSMITMLSQPEQLDDFLTIARPSIFDADIGSRRLMAIKSGSRYVNKGYDVNDETIRLMDGCLGIAGSFLDVKTRELLPKVEECYAQLPDQEQAELMDQLKSPNVLMSWEQIADGLHVFQNF